MLLLLLLFLWQALPADTSTVYVDPAHAGSRYSGPGTADRPYQTVPRTGAAGSLPISLRDTTAQVTLVGKTP